MSIASEPKLCPKCGATIPAEAPQGLCPKCLLLEISLPTEAGQGAGKSVPPTREELATAFPHLEILELIGQGGMGFVFKARQPKLDRFVALKILPQSLAADPAFAERFTREGRLLARLNHPNIVTVHDFGVASVLRPDVEPGFQPGGKSVDEGESEQISDAQANAAANPRGKMPRSTSGRMPDATEFFYLLMEFVDGVNLRQAMKAGRFTAEQALAVVPKICEALQFAHNEGILHRDIKPENILLDTKGRVKIADFGIAKLVSEASGRAGSPLPADVANQGSGAHGVTRPTGDLTAVGKTLGTPNYMAPEQIATPGAVDHRADIYSLGVVFYEMLTGELPLGRFAPPSQKSASDPRLDDVVLRALEKEPSRRTQSAGEVKTQVETIATNQPPPIIPATIASPKIKGFVRRGVVVGLLVFFLVVSATAVITFLLPKTYEAVARFKVEKTVLAADQRLQAYDPYFLQTEFEIIKSDAVLKSVVEHLNLAEQWGWRYGGSEKLSLFETVDLLRGMLVVRQLRNTSLIEIHFFDDNPSRSAEIANAILENYTAFTRGRSTEIHLVDRAVPNRRAIKPNIYLNIAIGILAGLLLGFLAGLMTTLFSRRRANQRTERPSEGRSTGETIADAVGREGATRARWWMVSPLSSPEVLEIMAHLTKAERSEFSFYGLLMGVWVVAATFGNLFLIKSFPAPGNWIVASIIAAIFIVSLPSMSRMQRRFLCSTAWAKQHGFVAEQIKLFSFSRQNLWRVLIFLGIGILLIFGQSKLFTRLSGTSELTASLKEDAARTKEHSARQVPQAKEKKATFSPMIERVVEEPVAPDYKWFDLDTGKAVSARAFPEDVEDTVVEDWMRKTGADIGSSVENHALIGRGGGLISVPVSATLWESASPKIISDLISQARPDGTVSALRADESLPATFAFRTREGGMGILQITGFTENPRGVKIRYKLVQADESNATGAMPAQPGTANSKELSVAADGSAAYTSIQAAINAAPDHAVIRIGPGRYSENLIISKPLSLRGAGWNQSIIGPVEPARGPSPEEDVTWRRRIAKANEAERERLVAEFQELFMPAVVKIHEAKLVECFDLKFTQPGTPPVEGGLPSRATVDISATEVLLKDCAIVGATGDGVRIQNGAVVSIRNSLIAAAWDTGVRIERTGQLCKVRITDSDIRNCYQRGVVIGSRQNNVTIERCRISGSAWHGIRYDDASPVILGSIVFANARFGIYASGSTAAIVRGNLFLRNEMGGMSCWYANGDKIEQNTFAGNLREGLSILGMSEPSIRSNIFSDHRVAITQGKIGDPRGSAQMQGTPQITTNLFWKNQTNWTSSAETNDSSAPRLEIVALDRTTGNLQADPKFVDPEHNDYSLRPDSPARREGIGAPELPRFASPWPLQPEEQAIISDGGTRDWRQWKRSAKESPSKL